MKFWTAFSGLLLASLFGMGGLCHWQSLSFAQENQGTSYITQANHAQEYDIHFGESWQSVRIFRLLSPLEKPLKVYVETHPGKSSLFKASYQAYVENSLRLWRQALNGRLRYEYTQRRADADITLDWVSAFPEPSIAGLTTYRVGHANIEIKTLGIPEADIQGNILHEFGHALGISGHSEISDDMMVGVRRWRRSGEAPYQPKLSARDVRAIQRLYSENWHKGEDLYASQAQAQPIKTTASSGIESENKMLQTTKQSAVSNRPDEQSPLKVQHPSHQVTGFGQAAIRPNEK